MEVKDYKVQLQNTIYLDSVFLLNLVMDLYLLKLTAKALGKTATYTRIFAGSFVGAIGYCIVLCLPGVSYARKVLLGMLPIGALMIKIVCRTKGIKELVYASGYLYFFSFLMGGLIIFLRGQLPLFKTYEDSVVLLAMLGFVGYVIWKKYVEASHRKKENCFCDVIINGDAGLVEIKALIDSGNGLVEPISQKPVAVLDEDVWKSMNMWMKPEKYKLIPYHSIGRNRGYLEGYEIAGMEVKGDWESKKYENVIIAVFKGNVSGKGSYQMILPSELSI